MPRYTWFPILHGWAVMDSREDCRPPIAQGIELGEAQIIAFALNAVYAGKALIASGDNFTTSAARLTQGCDIYDAPPEESLAP